MTSSLLKNPAANPGDAQRAASDPASSVWVNASAGSGKTSVLTKRVTRLLLAGVPPQKILCLTYTRAGAAEMANRVTRMLGKWAVCDDAELDADLFELQNYEADTAQRTEARRLFARVLSCPGGLRIRTIHSFCQEVLSRFPVEAGLPPHFALIDEQEMDVLQRDVQDDVLREAGENPHSGLAQALAILVAAQGEFGFDAMLREITQTRGQLSKAIEQAGGIATLVKTTRHFLNLAPDDKAETIRQEMMESLPEADMWNLVKGLAEGTPTHSDRGRIISAILETTPANRAARFYDYFGVYLTKEKQPRKQLGDIKILTLYPDITPLSEREATRLQSALERIEAAEIAELTEAVLVFGHAFSTKLAARKQARAALDYDDLISFTEKLLHRSGIAPWILYKLDKGLDHILVDEAQDTSRAQWNIVQALTTEFFAGHSARDGINRTLFVVGDEKQSIFSFQNADPESFLSERGKYAAFLPEAGKKFKKIGLHTSFRSAPAILSAVDAIFSHANAQKGVSVDAIRHTPYKNAATHPGRVEIWPLIIPAKNEAEPTLWPMPLGYEEEHDAQAELARQIATKIKFWLDRNTPLPGTTRAIAAGDIMILLRRRGRFADLMVRALKAQKVQVTGVDRMRLVNQLPVMDLLAMLRFVLLPQDDLNLATLLRSPLLGFSEDELMVLAIGRADSLWDALQASTHTKIRDYLTQKLAEADFCTPFVFLSSLLNTPCPADSISGRRAIWSRLGDESLDPIDELLNEAQSFGQHHAPSLQNFLHWLVQADAEIKRELDHGKKQDGGQVRIMTVHASKGLEAPIVFLPDTAAVPQSRDINKLQWNDDKTAPLFLARQPAFGAAQHVWQLARDKQIEEYRRLFYVALTRAESQLYICGWLGGRMKDAPEESWYALARHALQPMHQAHAVRSENPTPEIVHADNAPPVLIQQDAKTPSPPTPPIPAWARQKIATPPAMSIHANKDASTATPDVAFARGRIIHRLLQSLPDIDPLLRDAATQRFLSHPRHNLDAIQQKEIASEVNRLLNDKNFADLFAPGGLAEAPLTGTLKGAPVFRQVDRLCLVNNEVWIVDYKTNRPPPAREQDIPPAYRQQVDEYRALLCEIYPNKKVRCFLLWTYAPRLMEVTI